MLIEAFFSTCVNRSYNNLYNRANMYLVIKYLFKFDQKSPAFCYIMVVPIQTMVDHGRTLTVSHSIGRQTAKVILIFRPC